MAGPLRAIVFNADEQYAPELRGALLSLPDLRLVAELDEPSLLPQAVAQLPADLVIAHLDPVPLIALEVLSQVAAVNPRMPIFAISGSTEGDVLLRAMKAGLKRFLVKPLDIEELREGLAGLAQTQVHVRPRGKLISVMGSAGGVGATFLATNLAVEMAELCATDKSVALLDFDFRFGQVATVLDLECQYTVADLCATPETLDPAMVEKALVKHESGVYVLSRPHLFSQAELITAAHCANVMSVLQEMFQYIVIDGPSRSDPGGRTVLDAADFNFMVLQLLVTSVRNADRMMQELVAQGFPVKRFNFICNRVGRESAHLEIQQVERSLHMQVFHQIPDDWKTVSSAINVGQPLRTEFDKSKVRASVRELAMKVHCPESLAKPEKSAGLFGKLLKAASRTSPDKTPAPATPSPA